jgi:hypothetical protein
LPQGRQQAPEASKTKLVISFVHRKTIMFESRSGVKRFCTTIRRTGACYIQRRSLVFCADTNEEKATLLLTDDQCRLIAAVVTMNAYASDGRPIGRELLLKVFRARHAIRHGTIAVATDPDPLEKAAVMEMLYLRGDDK